MSAYKKTIVLFFLIVSLIISPLFVLTAVGANAIEGEQTGPAVMAVDLLFCRPLGFVAMLGGAAVFLVSSPFSALGGNFGEAWDSLVVNPAEYTFKRPLGEFE